MNKKLIFGGVAAIGVLMLMGKKSASSNYDLGGKDFGVTNTSNWDNAAAAPGTASATVGPQPVMGPNDIGPDFLNPATQAGLSGSSP